MIGNIGVPEIPGLMKKHKENVVGTFNTHRILNYEDEKSDADIVLS